ncbi:hypothetical protein GYMLUDRAFT_120742, partial [Collybiopsis luxurians FD-317 M1]
AQILALFLQSMCYGLFCTSTAACIQRTLSFRKRGQNRSSVKWLMFTVAGLMWIVGTLDVVLEVVRHLEAFVTSPEGPVAKFTNLLDWINIFKGIDIVVQALIGDALLIYRCWLIYNESWAVISVPLVLWIGVTASTIVAFILQVKSGPSITLENSILLPTFHVFWLSTITLNILTTSLIVYRIWKIHRETREIARNSILAASSSANRPSYLTNTIRVMIDSGVLNTSMSLITFATYLSRSNSIYITSDVVIEVSGIAFDLIIIRAAAFTRSQQVQTTQSLP